MKNFRRYIISLFLIIIMSCFVFAGCKNNEIATLSKQLSTPYLPEITYKNNRSLVSIDDGTGYKMLITDQNKYATAYVFAIYSGNLTSEEKSIIEANTNKSALNTIKDKFSIYRNDKPYLYVSDIFNQTRTYYFYYQNLGDNEHYFDSETTRIFSYTITAKLETPVISREGYRVSWNRVPNASRYEIVISETSQQDVVLNTKELSIDLESIIAGKYSNAIVKVRAMGDPHRVESDFSNDIGISGIVNLSYPTITSVTREKIVWTSVANADSYTIATVDMNVITELATVSGVNNYSLTQFFDERPAGVYSFIIKTNGSSYFIGSDYSPTTEFVYNIKLDTPVIDNSQSYQSGDNIYIYWSEVENAISYSVYVNGQYLDSTTSRALTVTMSYLMNAYNDTSFSFKVKANRNGYYLESEYSNTVGFGTLKLEAPVISQNSTYPTTIEWSSVSYAQTYKIYVNEVLVAETQTNIYNFATNASVPGQYKVYVISSSSTRFDSDKSNEITYIKKDTYLSPTITSVNATEDEFTIEFNTISSAQSYTLKVNDIVVDANITTSPYVLHCDSTCEFFSQDYEYSFALKTNASEYYDESSFATPTQKVFVLSVPQNLQVNKSNNYLSWGAVSGCTKYGVKVNNQDEVIVEGDNKFYLDDERFLLDNNRVYQITVRAIASGLVKASDYSTKCFLNMTTQSTSTVNSLNEYFNKQFFVYGEYYDYYMDSQEELNYAVVYTTLFELDINVYIGYTDGYSASSTYRLDLAKNYIFYLGTINGNYILEYVSNSNYKVVHIKYNSTIPNNRTIKTSLSTTPEHELYTNYVENPRGEYYQIVSDSYLVELPVYNSDQLAWSIMFGAKPVFKNSAPQEVVNIYSQAKQILNSILSENDTEYKKVVKIAEYIMANAQYDTSYSTLSQNNGIEARFHALEGFFTDHKVVCDGYSKTFALLCGMEGIETRVVAGTLSGAGHAWNKVYLDIDNDGQKEWYALDLTAADNYGYTINGKYVFSHKDFLVTDEQLTNRVSYEGLSYPEANTQFLYYSSTQNALNRSLYASSQPELISLIGAYKYSSLTCLDFAWSKSLGNIAMSLMNTMQMTGVYIAVYETDTYYYALTTYNRG